MTRQLVSIILVPVFLLMSMVSPAYAQLQAGGIITTSDYVVQADADAKRAALTAQFARADVQAQLEALGVNPADVEARVAAMSDSEVAQLHEHMADMPAGADAAGVLFLVLLIFVILDIAGVTDVFPFIDAAK